MMCMKPDGIGMISGFGKLVDFAIED